MIPWKEFVKARQTVKQYEKEARLEEVNWFPELKPYLIQLETLAKVKSTFFEGNNQVILYDLSIYSQHLDDYNCLVSKLSEVASKSGWITIKHYRSFDQTDTLILCKREVAEWALRALANNNRD